MKFIVKLFPEITIKSTPVRLRFIKILCSNIRHVLRRYAEDVAVVRHWDHIVVRGKDASQKQALCEALQRVPGVHHVLDVQESRFTDLHDIFLQTLACYQSLIANRSFCVRVKRRGRHDFSSVEAERYVGGGLNQQVASARVKLKQPDVTVNLEIEDDKLLLVQGRYAGLGGFPVGTQEDVLSLISGGFDSGVASYMLLRRGCRVHYCFFNLGGSAHEQGVRQVAWHLWQRFASSHRVRFVSVDFSRVVAEILQKVDDGQMGVVLKRMMVRAASQVARRYDVQALVTGEALGQVSSQTLTNLRLIDEVSDRLIVRPLIACDKPQIIAMAREIGTEAFAASMPEYCAVISKSPTVKALAHKLHAEEAKCDFSLLDDALANAVNVDIRQLAHSDAMPEVETVSEVRPGEVVLDIRASEEQQDAPLTLPGAKVLALPFYKLYSQFASLDQSKTWLLWCARGVISRQHALHLHEQGFSNVKVLRLVPAFAGSHTENDREEGDP